MKFHAHSALLMVLTVLTLSACAPPNHTENADNIDYFTPDSEIGLMSTDPTRRQLARLFLVEQPTITVNPTMVKTIQTGGPGGILFWNNNKVGALETREVVRRYSAQAKASEQSPLLFSLDYEGGTLGFTPKGTMVPGIQRIQKGLTRLAHPVWLGKTMPRFADEACRLHGEILARELNSVGINYPLATVSDLAERLVTLRGISQDPDLVARCMQAIMTSVQNEGNMIFVTKHFPGLGPVSGDTHQGIATSLTKTAAELEDNIHPYRLLLQFLQDANADSKLSIMSTHAFYPMIDKKNITTESPLILTHLLRDQLGFKGIRLSDAMWMGDYGKLGNDRLMPVYISAILAGEDMLMIPGVKFKVALNYVRLLYDGKLSSRQQAALEAHLGQSFTLIRDQFIQRAKEAFARQDFSLRSIAHSVDVVSAKGVVPMNLTTAARARYYEILAATDPRWQAHLPRPGVPIPHP